MRSRDREILDQAIVVGAECQRVAQVLRTSPPDSASAGELREATAVALDELDNLIIGRLDSAATVSVAEDYGDKWLWEVPQDSQAPRLELIPGLAAALDAHARALLNLDPPSGQVLAELTTMTVRTSLLAMAFRDVPKTSGTCSKEVVRNGHC